MSNLQLNRHLPKTNKSTRLVLIVTNDTNVVVIIFSMTVLDSNMPISTEMVDLEEKVGLVMAMVEETVTGEEAKMFPVAIAPGIDVMVTVKLPCW